MAEESPNLKTLFDRPSVVGYRRSKNLKDNLFRAKLPAGKKSTRKKPGFRNCGGMCMTCILSHNTTTHRNNHTGETWKIYAELGCKSEDVVYKIACKKCRDFVCW